MVSIAHQAGPGKENLSLGFNGFILSLINTNMHLYVHTYLNIYLKKQMKMEEQYEEYLRQR